MKENQLEQARTEAIAADKCFSKGRLRDEFRMKPKPDAEPVAFYKNGYGGKLGVYRIADCLPMRARCSSPTTVKQARAQAILSLRAKMGSNLAKASALAGDWLGLAPLVLDTETTGLGHDAQVIELAVTDISGDVLLNTRLRSTIRIEPEATDVHGIHDVDLIAEPTWPKVAPLLSQILLSRHVVIFKTAVF
ncbi:3'-5' exonuclease [Photorhabdus sp. RM96S]|uniref:3'-5' exonuclease n=1 Tax=Photorhabdus sp. RM96S TaxID=3342822 RepID=UPI0036D7D1EB